MTTPNPEHEHFFRYTSGRWLWDEEQQLRDSCISITKLGEGGYNKVFRLIMNDGKTVLARIPNPNAGPAFYSTASEVATMELARDFLQIPVPRVIDWSATSNNAVGSEYIIMEEASGTQLGLIWDQLSADEKLSIMREIVTIESKMLAVSFSHFGSIYFASDAVENAVPALLTPGASSELKERVYEKFSIGPTVDRSFWNKERSSMPISRGPYNFDDLDPEQQADIKQKIFKSTLLQLYLLETEKRNPLLAKAFELDHGKTRRLPVEFAGNTWDDDIVRFREALINVERYWQELGIQGECPYHFTQDELHSHSVDAEGSNEVQDFFDSIEGLVKRDGWTYPDTFEAAFNFFSELRKRGLETMTEKIEFSASTAQEIQEAVRGAKAGRAPGKDGILNSVWHKLIKIPVILKRLVRLLNACIDAGYNLRRRRLGHFVPWVKAFINDWNKMIRMPGGISGWMLTLTGIP
ncbi:hypothetical protein N7461_006561 [Penicillium sp. DV-2018c]|nr:hypothetical protein N7461_006561 [Penicillium sp. DV-2018c]